MAEHSLEARAWAQEVQAEFEKLALDHAREQGFDYRNEPHGLFRAYMSAMTYNGGELLKQAGRIVAERKGKGASDA